MLYTDITELIGDTPLLLLDKRVHGLSNVDLYAKLEFLNPFGSVKDRVAWGMIRDDLADIVERGLTLIEASSGNTAKALQVLAGMRGLTLEVLTNRVKVPEVRDVLDVLGSKVQELPGLSECPDPTVPNDVFSTIESIMAASPGAYYHASQYTNEKNVETHYRDTGSEIFADIGPVDFLFGGLGTTGSTRGIGTYLREKNPALKTIGVVSTKYDFIPGIRSANELWDVGLFDRGFYEKIVAVDSADAVDGAVQLARRYGVLAGPTSGATYFAAVEHLRGEPSAERRKAVLIVCDRLEWYLSYVRKRRPEIFGLARRPSVRDLPPDVVAPEIGVDALEQLLGSGNAMLVDTRGSMAYRIGHIPGAVNIRDDRLDDMLADGVPFPPGLQVVFVCPIGEYSRRVAAFLSQQGHRAASLTGGVVAWRDAGRKLEPGA
ncbi:hypothetical protein GCM10009765_20890 [Fodinicola feengrottensis]|uniref:Rhodanese domain-containing protein n=1 Tax=Fodinicola feengrottensis TaxID=435914 RepID=A0ABN2GHA7_9ACTN